MEPDDLKPTVEAEIGQLTVAMMDFVQESGLTELTVAGLVLAGKTESDRSIVLTRTTTRDPYACLPMWDAAADLELTAIRKGTERLAARVKELEAQLEDQE